MAAPFRRAVPMAPPEHGDDPDPFGVVELLRRRSPDLVDRLSRRRHPRDRAADSEALPAKTASPTITRLPFLENVFCLTRASPAMHRVRVEYEINGDPVAAVCSWLPGQAAASVSSCLGRGPCCAVHDSAVSLRGTLAPAEERDAAIAAAVSAVQRRAPHGAAVRRTTYLGFYGEATITELLSRTAQGSTAEGDLRRALEAERASAASAGGTAETAAGVAAPALVGSGGRSAAQLELDRLDIDCMLSILGPPHSSSARPAAPATTAPVGGDSLVVLASATLFFDSRGRPICTASDGADPSTGAASAPLSSLVDTLTTATASLRSVGLRHDTLWLPFRRARPGSLLLLQLSRRCALAGADALSVVAEVQGLADAAASAWATAHAKSGATVGLEPAPPRPWADAGWLPLLHTGDTATHALSDAGRRVEYGRALRELRWVELQWRPRRLRRPGMAPEAREASGGIDIIALDVGQLGAALNEGAPFVDFVASSAALGLRYALRCHAARSPPSRGIDGSRSPLQFSVEVLVFTESGATAVSRGASSDAASTDPAPLAALRAGTVCDLVCAVPALPDMRVGSSSTSPALAASDMEVRDGLSSLSWFCNTPSVIPSGLAVVMQGVLLRERPQVGREGGATAPAEDQKPFDVVVEARQAAHY